MSARGLDYSLPTCGDTQCHGKGTCMLAMEGLVCECMLGYKGEFCTDTVNEALSLPLTLGVLAFIVGLLILAFIFAKLRQKQKRRKRSALLALQQGYNVSV